MLSETCPFPAPGSIGFLAGTAEPARILQICADGTVLVERRRRTPDGGTAPLDGASANRRIDANQIFASPEVALFGSARKARAARRGLVAGGRR